MAKDDVFDFRMAKLQHYIRKRHAEGKPVPSAYAAIEHNLDADHIRAWLERCDANTEKIKAVMRTVAAAEGDAEFPAPWTEEPSE